MSGEDEFWQQQQRISYYWVREGLEADETFPREALEALKRIDPDSTHSTASSASELLNYWAVERELTVFERGKPVADIAAVVLYPDEDGDYSASDAAVERGWRVDRTNLEWCLTRYGLATPKFLNMYDLPPDQQEPNEIGYTIGGAARAIATKYGVNADVAEQILKRLVAAAADGEFPVRDPMSEMCYTPDVRRTDWERVSISDMNAWFVKFGYRYRLGDDVASLVPNPATNIETSASREAATAPTLASREQVKRKVLLERLGRQFPKLETALRGNTPAWQECRVSREDAPGKTGGYYYFDAVENLCFSMWPKAHEVEPGLRGYAMVDGKRVPIK